MEIEKNEKIGGYRRIITSVIPDDNKRETNNTAANKKVGKETDWGILVYWRNQVKVELN